MLVAATVLDLLPSAIRLSISWTIKAKQYYYNYKISL
jgi:hypothetical protein